MEDSIQDVEQLKMFLQEAMEMLEDSRHKMALFECQRYSSLKNNISKFNSLPDALRTALSTIPTI